MTVAILTALALAVADLLFACGYWRASRGVPAVRVLQNIAAGILGKRAFLGGGEAALLGVLLHCFIMFAMVGAYYLACRRFAPLLARPWLFGGLYGALLFVVMNLLVVPLSAVPKAPLVPTWIVCSIAMHIIIGLAIALSARRAFRV
jgi:hypothetical protein